MPWRFPHQLDRRGLHAERVGAAALASSSDGFSERAGGGGHREAHAHHAIGHVDAVDEAERDHVETEPRGR